MAEPTTTADTAASATGTVTAPNGSTAAPMTGDAGFLATLPEELRGEASLKDFRDTGALAKAFVATKRMVGESFRVPPADAPPEVQAKFRAALGVPESADKYGLELPALPEGVPGWDQGKVTRALQAFHAAGYTPAQARAAIDVYTELILEGHDAGTAAAATQRRDAEAALEKSWGPKGSVTYKRNLSLASAAFHRYMPESVKDQFDAKYGNDPVFLEAFAAIGERGLEDGAIDATEYETQSKETIQARIDAIRKDPKHPFNFPGTPGFAAAQAEVEKLYKQLYGTRELTQPL